MRKGWERDAELLKIKAMVGFCLEFFEDKFSKLFVTICQ